MRLPLILLLRSQLLCLGADADGGAIVLSAEDFDDVRALGSKKNALVMFFAPWCGHCKRLAPVFDQVDEQFGHDDVVIAKVDCTGDSTRHVCVDEGVRSYPTLKYYSALTGPEGQTHGGSRDYESLRALVEGSLLQSAGATKLQLLASEDFHSEVFGTGSKNAFVKFFAPWCGHCKALAPAWEQLAQEHGDAITIARVDCTTDINDELCTQQRALGFPHLKF